MARKLAVFDIDDTLVRSKSVDEEYFVRAFADALGFEGIDTDWARYAHATDSGITEQIFRGRLGRPPGEDEIAHVCDYFVALLGDAARRSPERFAAMPGATAVLHRLDGRGSWAAAIATGGWRAAASLKVEAAGLDIARLPAAFAEDGPSRESIVCTAIDRARVRHRCDTFDRVVCIGDSIWDVRAAARLELPFIGVKGEANSTVLVGKGVSHVLTNFTDVDRFDQALEECTIPVPPC